MNAKKTSRTASAPRRSGARIRDMASQVACYTGMAIAYLAGFTVVLWSAVAVLEAVGWIAAIATVVLFPITLFVGPGVAAIWGEWTLAFLFIVTFGALPVTVVGSLAIEKTLDHGVTWLLGLVGLIALVFVTLPGVMVLALLDRLLGWWRVWVAVRNRTRAEEPDQTLGEQDIRRRRVAELVRDTGELATMAAVVLVIVLSAVDAHSAGGWLAATTAVLLWPVTVFAGPLVAAFHSEWTLPMVMVAALAVMPFAALVTARVDPAG